MIDKSIVKPILFSGVDVVALMQSIGFSEKMTNRLESGNPAYTNLALAYALYKIATPARYTVTLGKIFFFFFSCITVHKLFSCWLWHFKIGTEKDWRKLLMLKIGGNPHYSKDSCMSKKR